MEVPSLRRVVSIFYPDKIGFFFWQIFVFEVVLQQKLLHFFLKTKSVVLKVAVVHSSLTVGDLKWWWLSSYGAPFGEPRASACPRKDGNQLLEKKHAIHKRKSGSLFFEASLSLYICYTFGDVSTQICIYTHIYRYIYTYTTYILNMLKQQVQIVFLGTLWFLSCSPEQIGMFVLKKRM